MLTLIILNCFTMLVRDRDSYDAVASIWVDLGRTPTRDRFGYAPCVQLFSDPVLAKMYSTEPDKAIAISDYAAGRGAFGWNSFLKSINAPPNAGTAQGADCELGSFPPCSAGEVIDLIFLVAFTFEMLFKLLAFGLVLHPGAYFRVGWCGLG